MMELFGRTVEGAFPPLHNREVNRKSEGDFLFLETIQRFKFPRQVKLSEIFYACVMKPEWGIEFKLYSIHIEYFVHCGKNWEDQFCTRLQLAKSIAHKFEEMGTILVDDEDLIRAVSYYENLVS